MQPTFRALADPTRRNILLLLRDGDRSVSALTDNFAMTRAAVKKHLTVLSDGGLITMAPRGRETLSHLEPQGLAPARHWFDHFNAFWDSRLADLEAAINRRHP